MRVGILGAGQLSRMLALAGIPLGISFSFFDSGPTNNIVSQLGQLFKASFDDKDTLEAFLESVDVVTFENENIPYDTLSLIQRQKPLNPPSEALKVMQDRYLEKKFFNALNIPTTPFALVNDKNDLQEFIEKYDFPVVLKKRTNGYDGKGQWVLRTNNDTKDLGHEVFHNCIVEAFIRYDREVSIIGCRSQNGDMRFYEICENQHQNGILFQTQNRRQDRQMEIAQQYLEQVMMHFSYVGVCTIEFFENQGQLIANEMAPRVHNSGHWTIEGAETSQFENHLRCILDLPLGCTASRGNFMMYNLLGQIPDLQTLLKNTGVHVHDYQKAPRVGRKLGHLTVDTSFFSKGHELSFDSFVLSSQETLPQQRASKDPTTCQN